MKDYSAMDDSSINTAVGLSFGEKVGEVVNGLQLVNIDAQYLCSSFDPCNNPADAWPLLLSIVSSGAIISISSTSINGKLLNGKSIARKITELYLSLQAD